MGGGERMGRVHDGQTLVSNHARASCGGNTRYLRTFISCRSLLLTRAGLARTLQEQEEADPFLSHAGHFLFCLIIVPSSRTAWCLVIQTAMLKDYIFLSNPCELWGCQALSDLGLWVETILHRHAPSVPRPKENNNKIWTWQSIISSKSNRKMLLPVKLKSHVFTCVFCHIVPICWHEIVILWCKFYLMLWLKVSLGL